MAAATGLASHSCALTTGAAPRLRDFFNHASLSAIRSARSAKSGSSSIIGARATSTTTTARHATQAVAIPIQISIGTSSMLLCRRLEVNALQTLDQPLLQALGTDSLRASNPHRSCERRQRLFPPRFPRWEGSNAGTAAARPGQLGPASETVHLSSQYPPVQRCHNRRLQIT
jgi:hypothetical protein